MNIIRNKNSSLSTHLEDHHMDLKTRLTTTKVRLQPNDIQFLGKLSTNTCPSAAFLYP